MDHRTAEKINTGDVVGKNVSEPTFARMMAFYFLISFVGLLAIVPMRKVCTTVRPCRSKIELAPMHLIIAR
jgi:hypothetical protein